MASVKGSICDMEGQASTRPDCLFKDQNMLFRVAKLEGQKNKNIKAFCLNEDDVSYYIMSSVSSWVKFPSSRCPTEDEVYMTPMDKKEDGTAVSVETESARWTKYYATQDQCPDSTKGCHWRKPGAPKCQKSLPTKGKWTCYKQYQPTDPDLCNKGGVC